MKKVIIDNNLPSLIKKELLSFDCHSVKEVLRPDSTDKEILDYCIKNKIDILITKDKNFAWLISDYNSKLKVILVRTGNISIFNLLNLIKERYPAIEYFYNSGEKILII